MLASPPFGPQAQTPAQRTQVLHQMQQTFAHLRRPTPALRHLYGRYVTGELSWPEVCALRDAPSVIG